MASAVPPEAVTAALQLLQALTSTSTGAPGAGISAESAGVLLAALGGQVRAV